jgi:hypothetical protein
LAAAALFFGAELERKVDDAWFELARGEFFRAEIKKRRAAGQ